MVVTSFLWSLFSLSLFTVIVGITHEQFEWLLSQIQDQLERTRIGSCNETITNTAGRPRRIDAREQLLMFLVWMRQYPVLNFLAWLTGTSKSMVQKYNHTTLNVLFQYFDPLIHLPSKHIRQKHGSWLRGALITLVIDGTEQQVLRPLRTMLDKALYSGMYLLVLH